jgi:serine protease
MKAYVYAITVLFMFSAMQETLAQNTSETGYLLEGTLIVRVKDEYREFCEERDISHPLFHAVFSEIGGNKLEKMFPFHKAPENKLNQFGEQMVDISLIYVVSFSPEHSLSLASHLLMTTGIFMYAEPYVIPELLYTPNDPLVANQYYLNNIRAYDAWEIWKGDTNYVVGIIDTGYEFNHPDLVNAVKYNYNDPIDGLDNDNDGYVDNFRGWNLGENNNNPQYSALGHGIHVSGIAGATADNTFGIAGVGFKTKILPVKIDNQMGALTMSYQGIVYAADHGAHTINCSWGSTFGVGQFGQDIVNYATYNKNAIVVAAAGNSNNELLFYPCSYQNVFCVAGTKSDDSKWENSSYYWRVDISAPGHNIYSTWASGTFVYSGGTSMAAPAVAGAAAFVWSYFPALSPLQVVQHLKNTADVIDTLSQNIVYSDKLGYGRLNMYRALTDTMLPGIQLRSLAVSDNNDGVFVMNDTLFITGNFINYLAPTQNLQITLCSSSPYIQSIDTIFIAGVQPTFAEFSNPQPFTLKLLSGMPSSHKVKLKFCYSDQNYSGRDYHFITVNIDFLDLDINKITTTVTSKGKLGYNDNENFQQGSGFSYNNSSSLSQCSGFLFGRANNQVSDNIYGFTTSFDSDLVPVESVSYIEPPLKGDQHITGKFNDSGAGTGSMNVEVIHEEYAWNDVDKEDFIVLDYYLLNNGTNDLTNVYVGFFNNWELKISSQNRAATNNSERFGYVYSLDSSLFAAVQLLTPGNFIHYAIDNDGQDGSVNLNDGFSSTEKFISLTNTRTTAGNYQFGNNISSVVSTGPFVIPAGDTIHVAFALHIENSYIELMESVSQAAAAWDGLIHARLPELVSGDISIFPNPFDDYIHVCFPDDIVGTIVLTDVLGREVKSIDTQHAGCVTLQTGHLPSGIYILNCNWDHSSLRKLIKL